jgi:hypothetical protein
MNETTHTQGEWAVGRRGLDVVCNGATILESPRTPNTRSKADAARVVLCCNAHDDLVAALKVLLRESMAPTDDGGRWDDACAFARQVLAKAGEK